jgi:hypothetical protein
VKIFLVKPSGWLYLGGVMKTQNTNRKEILRHEIMKAAQSKNMKVTGDFWFALIFRSESELKKIAQELHINA